MCSSKSRNALEQTLTIQDIITHMESICPPELAASWDNTGLLLGDPGQSVAAIMTCLSLSRRTCQEAVGRKADLVISHHPVPFRPVPQITTVDLTGWILWQLSRQGIAIYSPHTAFDSAAEGINQQLAERFGLRDIRPLRPLAHDPGLGEGRFGQLPEEMPLLQFAQHVKQVLGLREVRLVGSLQMGVSRVAVACGAAGEFLEDARRVPCQALVLGETNYHTCLRAEFFGVGLVIVGHHASERHGVERLASVLRDRFPQLDVWASQAEQDPVITI